MALEPYATQCSLCDPCLAVPYEEDDRDPKIWFLDHSYMENMFGMFKKVNGEHQQFSRPIFNDLGQGFILNKCIVSCIWSSWSAAAASPSKLRYTCS